MLHRIIAPFAALFLGACATAPLPQAAASQVELHSAGVVSAADPRAAEAGAAMLRKGGSATDAAIATMLALTVVEPQSSGIGGGGFYVHATPSGEVDTIDGREKAPSGADGSWLLGPDGKPLGFREVVNTGLSVGVPGNIALAAEAHELHGKLPWADLIRKGWRSSTIRRVSRWPKAHAFATRRWRRRWSRSPAKVRKRSMPARRPRRSRRRSRPRRRGPAG
jgi:gamma-glutamyltranspeptidase/glutathione hydrolase